MRPRSENQGINNILTSYSPIRAEVVNPRTVLGAEVAEAFRSALTTEGAGLTSATGRKLAIAEVMVQGDWRDEFNDKECKLPLCPWNDTGTINTTFWSRNIAHSSVQTRRHIVGLAIFQIL